MHTERFIEENSQFVIHVWLENQEPKVLKKKGK